MSNRPTGATTAVRSAPYHPAPAVRHAPAAALHPARCTRPATRMCRVAHTRTRTPATRRSEFPTGFVRRAVRRTPPRRRPSRPGPPHHRREATDPALPGPQPSIRTPLTARTVQAAGPTTPRGERQPDDPEPHSRAEPAHGLRRQSRPAPTAAPRHRASTSQPQRRPQAGTDPAPPGPVPGELSPAASCTSLPFPHLLPGLRRTGAEPGHESRAPSGVLTAVPVPAWSVTASRFAGSPGTPRRCHGPAAGGRLQNGHTARTVAVRRAHPVRQPHVGDGGAAHAAAGRERRHPAPDAGPGTARGRRQIVSEALAEAPEKPSGVLYGAEHVPGGTAVAALLDAGPLRQEWPGPRLDGVRGGGVTGSSHPRYVRRPPRPPSRAICRPR